MSTSQIELSVVLPVYNEPSIDRVVREVVALVDDIAPGAGEVIVVDDCSTDGTPSILAALVDELPTLRVLTQRPNRGHGPALLTGFDHARGAWIGHLDTDDQIPTAELGRLWVERKGRDLVLGDRVEREDPQHRLVLTWFVRGVVSLLARRRLHDANVPCKLFTRELWGEVRPLLDDGTFAPSVALAVVAARRGRSIHVIEVTHRARSEGETTLKPVKLARAVLRSTSETVKVARRV